VCLIQINIVKHKLGRHDLDLLANLYIVDATNIKGTLYHATYCYHPVFAGLVLRSYHCSQSVQTKQWIHTMFNMAMFSKNGITVSSIWWYLIAISPDKTSRCAVSARKSDRYYVNSISMCV